jgi:hypothetical protein
MLDTRYREQMFLDWLRSKGIEGERCTQSFALRGDDRYTPDVFVPALDLYIEVVGSKQAFAINRQKYAEMVQRFPVNFALFTYDGKPLQPFLRDRMMRRRIKDSTCCAVNCEKPSTKRLSDGRTLCTKHYRRFQFGAPLNQMTDSSVGRKPRVQKCSFDSCDRVAKAIGLCMAHYQQRYHGHVLSPIRHRAPNGSSNGQPKHTVETFHLPL